MALRPHYKAIIISKFRANLPGIYTKGVLKRQEGNRIVLYLGIYKFLSIIDLRDKVDKLIVRDDSPDDLTGWLHLIISCTAHT